MKRFMFRVMGCVIIIRKRIFYIEVVVKEKK